MTEPAPMRAAVWLDTNEVVLRDAPRPDVPGGWSLVRVEYTGICGTDLAIFAGEHPRAAGPLVLGHEIVGVVEGGRSEGLPPGTRIAVEPLISCGSCRACRGGSTHVCRDLKLYGIDKPGGLAEYVAVPTDRLIPVNPDVPAERAAWAEPLAVAVHSVARANMSGDEAVLVFGAGPIGILVALVARRAGAARVAVVEPNRQRQDVAEELGFEVAPANLDPVDWFRATNDGEGADLVFDTAGHPSVAALLPRAVCETGTVVIVAVYKDAPTVDLRAVCFGEQHLVGARVYTRADFVEAVGLLADDQLGLDHLPITFFGLDAVQEAFGLASSGEAPMKVAIRS